MVCWLLEAGSHAGLLTSGLLHAVVVNCLPASSSCVSLLVAVQLRACSVLLSVCQISHCGELAFGLFSRMLSIDHEGMVSAERWDQDDCSLQVSLLFMQCRSLSNTVINYPNNSCCDIFSHLD